MTSFRNFVKSSLVLTTMFSQVFGGNVLSSISSGLSNLALPDFSFSIFNIAKIQCNFSKIYKNAVSIRISSKNICEYANSVTYPSDFFSNGFAVSVVGCDLKFSVHSSCLDTSYQKSFCSQFQLPSLNAASLHNVVAANSFVRSIPSVQSGTGTVSSSSSDVSVVDSSFYPKLIQPYVYIYDDALKDRLPDDNSLEKRRYDGSYTIGDSYKEIEIECKINGKDCSDPQKAKIPTNMEVFNKAQKKTIELFLKDPLYGFVSDSPTKRDVYERYVREHCLSADSESVCIKNVLKNDQLAPFAKEEAETQRRLNLLYSAKNYFIEKSFLGFHRPLYYGKEFIEKLPPSIAIEYAQLVTKDQAVTEFLRTMLKRGENNNMSALKVIDRKNKFMAVFFGVKDSMKSYKELLNESVQ